MTNLMRALNWSGIAFVDMRYDEEDKQPKVLEMNPRYWASLLGSYAAGVNFPYLAYLASTNIDFPRPKYHFIRYTYTQKLYSLLLKKWLGGDNTISNVKYTSLPFTLSDPLPEIFQYSSDIFEKLFHKA